jgi:hypothetical protein
MRWSLFMAAVLTAGAAAPALAQGGRPAAAQRIVQTWDFDDPLSRVEPVPVGWFRAQDHPGERDRPGYPGWNVPAISRESARSGQRSVALPTRGGNTSLTLSAGAVAALPDADYAVRAFVRTVGLSHARARVKAWLLDEHLTPIEGSTGTSAATATVGGWEEVIAEVRGHPRAAWLQIELLLLQPREFDAARSEHHVWPEDFAGVAYVDDVQVSQVPRVELTTSAAAGVFVEPETPEVLLAIRDLTGEPLFVEIEVRDIDGGEVQRETFAAPEGGRRTPWRPRVERFGWYSVRMTVHSESEVVGRRRLDFIWAPALPAPDRSHQRAFGVVAEGLGPPGRAALREFLPAVFAGSASLAVFAPDSADAPPAVPMESLRADAESLLALGIDLTFVLTNLPRSLTHELRIDPDDPIPLLLSEKDPWMPYLSRTFTLFGERVRRWQLGPTGGETAEVRADLAADLDAIRRKLRVKIPRPLLAVPWALNLDARDANAAADSITLSWPLGVPAGEIESGFAASVADTPNVERTLHIEIPSPEVYGGRAASIELARRGTSAWAASGPRLIIDHAWSLAPESPDRLQPTPLAAVWRTLSAVLSPRRIVGRLPLADGVTVYMAEGSPGTDGVLIGWSDGADPAHAVLEGWLGGGDVAAMDPFGNRRPVPVTANGDHLVHFDETPTIVTGVDVALARFRALTRIDPPFLASRAERHEVAVVIENPWPIGITGRLRLAEPVEWTIAPRVIPFVLGPGEASRVPVELAFTPGQEAGRQRLIAEIDLAAERRYPVMRWPLALDLGLPTVDLSPSYRIEPSPAGRGMDLVVSLLITNLGDSPLTVEAFAQAPGYRAFEAPVSGLEPGASVTRRFRFDAGGERLRGRTVRVGLKETSGTGRLNRTLNIHEPHSPPTPHPEP